MEMMGRSFSISKELPEGAVLFPTCPRKGYKVSILLPTKLNPTREDFVYVTYEDWDLRWAEVLQEFTEHPERVKQAMKGLGIEC